MRKSSAENIPLLSIDMHFMVLVGWGGFPCLDSIAPDRGRRPNKKPGTAMLGRPGLYLYHEESTKEKSILSLR